MLCGCQEKHVKKSSLQGTPISGHRCSGVGRPKWPFIHLLYNSPSLLWLIPCSPRNLLPINPIRGNECFGKQLSLVTGQLCPLTAHLYSGLLCVCVCVSFEVKLAQVPRTWTKKTGFLSYTTEDLIKQDLSSGILTKEHSLLPAGLLSLLQGDGPIQTPRMLRLLTPAPQTVLGDWHLLPHFAPECSLLLGVVTVPHASSDTLEHSVRMESLEILQQRPGDHWAEMPDWTLALSGWRTPWFLKSISSQMLHLSSLDWQVTEGRARRSGHNLAFSQWAWEVYL
jgi:hypothetical protein